MKKIQVYLCSMACVMALTMCRPGTTTTADYGIVPLPASVQTDTSAAPFRLTPRTVIAYASPALEKEAAMLSDYIAGETGMRLATAADRGDIVLFFFIDKANTEFYTISVSEDGVTVTGASEAGTFYGVQ
ncbi:MAG: glycoside hydrolase family 20 zincin-like fold domain-containing protein, partial [Muribaculaceae bacterium]|nr:glycoside hydrolase family 20 zincin-like fold domain-containing protein [Muribaculaceae bacterium]